MKSLAFAALLTPFLLLALLLGAALTHAHHNAETPAGQTISVACVQQDTCASPAGPITTLPVVTVYAGISHTANINDTRSAMTRWLNTLETPTTANTPLVMPYYSFAVSPAVATNKG